MWKNSFLSGDPTSLNDEHVALDKIGRSEARETAGPKSSSSSPIRFMGIRLNIQFRVAGSPKTGAAVTVRVKRNVMVVEFFIPLLQSP